MEIQLLGIIYLYLKLFPREATVIKHDYRYSVILDNNKGSNCDQTSLPVLSYT